VTFLTKLRRWVRAPADPEEEAEAQRMRADRDTARETQLTKMRGIGGLPPSTRDVDDPRH
jgi:hypothetical protein